MLKREHPGAALVLGGDFNASPRSALYEYLVSGTAAVPACSGVVSPPPSPFPLAEQLHSGHALALTSAYRSVMGREFVTNAKGPPESFYGILDYMFSSPELVPVTVLPVPTLRSLKSENGGLPNSFHGSDHVPIGARYVLGSHPAAAAAREPLPPHSAAHGGHAYGARAPAGVRRAVHKRADVRVCVRARRRGRRELVAAHARPQAQRFVRQPRHGQSWLVWLGRAAVVGACRCVSAAAPVIVGGGAVRRRARRPRSVGRAQ